MTKVCNISPENKKQYIADLGEILVKDYGKKKYYKPEEVKKSHNRTDWVSSLDFSCWGMSVYSSHHDFDAYHLSSGEVCSYTDMKSEMLVGITDDVSFFDLPDVEVDESWIDLSGTFEAIGDFFSSIIDIDF